MLIVPAFRPTQTPVAEYDEFVPLTLTWPAYHRTLDPPRTIMLRGPEAYLEVKLNAQDGELLELVVVSAVALASPAKVDDEATAVEPYVPIIDLPALATTVNTPDLKFEAYQNCLRIVFRDRAASRSVGAHPVTFSVDRQSSLTSTTLHWTPSERSTFLAACSSVKPLTM